MRATGSEQQTLPRTPKARWYSDIRCVECDAVAQGAATGWRAFIAGGYDDTPLEVVVFCPGCAARECEGAP